MARINFDANEVEPSQEFKPIPSGKYLAIITESEMVENSKKTGFFLKLAFQVVEGEHKGRILWARLNLKNPNETAVQIAQGELSSICRAVNVMTPDESQELHDLPLMITVKLERRSDTGDDANVIKGYGPRSSSEDKPEVAKQADKDRPVWDH